MKTFEDFLYLRILKDMDKLELQQQSQALKKRLYKRIIFFIITSLILVISQRNVQKTTNVDDLKEYKYQCENYIKTEAKLASNYDQLKFRRIASEVNVNTFYYLYQVNGETYKASKTSLSKEPDDLKIMVWYDKADPSLNKKEDPCDFYNKIKNREISKSNKYFFYICFGCLFVLIYLIFSIIKTIGKIFFNSIENKIKK